MSKLYIGVMSGTSLDGIDVALCEIDGDRCIVIAYEEYPFPERLKVRILGMIAGKTTLQEMGEIDHVLSIHYAAVIQALIAGHGIHTENIQAIGLHGQTLWHAPDDKYPFTLQCGDPNMVAFRTGIDVVADIRRKDMAAGGQGAPFAPAFHAFLFGKEKPKTAVVNIGGMANISILGERVIGYDTGCGNVLLDGWIERCLSQPYDTNGEWARSGKVIDALLELFLQDEYFAKSYPKSTGREYFNLQWVEDSVKKIAYAAPQDIQRTLLELTAVTIAKEAQRFQTERLVVCGGGVKNSFLMERLSQWLPSCEVVSSDALGVSSEAMESMMMAWLAYKRIHQEPVALSSVTGASRDVVLGGLYVAD